MLPNLHHIPNMHVHTSAGRIFLNLTPHVVCLTSQGVPQARQGRLGARRRCQLHGSAAAGARGRAQRPRRGRLLLRTLPRGLQVGQAGQQAHRLRSQGVVRAAARPARHGCPCGVRRRGRLGRAHVQLSLLQEPQADGAQLHMCAPTALEAAHRAPAPARWRVPDRTSIPRACARARLLS